MAKRTDKLNIAEAAKRLGMSVERLSAELQRDAKREPGERRYPFANPIQSEDNGRWTYNISAVKLESYLSPAPHVDFDRLEHLVGRLEKALEKMGA